MIFTGRNNADFHQTYSTFCLHTPRHTYTISPLPDHEHAEVGQVSCHAKDGGLEVLLVAGQVNEGDDLGGFLADLGPVQASSMTVWLVHYLGDRQRGQSFTPGTVSISLPICTKVRESTYNSYMMAPSFHFCKHFIIYYSLNNRKWQKKN